MSSALPLMLIGGLALMGSLGYGVAYAMGRYRHLAGRVALASTAGLGAGVLGWESQRVNRYPALNELLGSDYSKKTPIAQLAEKLGHLTGVSHTIKKAALKRELIDRRAIWVSSLAQPKLKTAMIAWDPRLIFGHGSWKGQDVLISPLMEEVLISLFIEEGLKCGPKKKYQAIEIDLTARVECQYGFNQLASLIGKFGQIPNLTGIHSDKKCYQEKHVNLLLSLYEQCPSLVEVPCDDPDVVFCGSNPPQDLVTLHLKQKQMQQERLSH